jgi:hypothetical protein
VHWGHLRPSEVLITWAIALAAAAFVWVRAMRQPPEQRTRWRRFVASLAPIAIGIDFLFLGLLGVHPVMQLNAGAQGLWDIWSWFRLFFFLSSPLSAFLAFVAIGTAIYRRSLGGAIEWAVVWLGALAGLSEMMGNAPSV